MPKKRRNRNVRRATSPDRLRAAEKQQAAFALRKEGHSYAEIAKRIGFRDKSSAHKAVMRALDAMLREPAEEMRAIQLERCDELLQAQWPGAKLGDTKACQAALAIMDRIDRLTGLKPTPNVNVAVQADVTVAADLEAMRQKIIADPASAELACALEERISRMQGGGNLN